MLFVCEISTSPKMSSKSDMALLKPKYSKVFKFKGFHIKRRPPKGGWWALGPCWAESNSLLTQGMRLAGLDTT